MHTPGPYIVKYEFNVMAGDDLRIVAACGGHSSNRNSNRVHEENIGNAQLCAAAMDSYDKHFGPNAVEAAKSDALGEAINLLAGVVGDLEAHFDNLRMGGQASHAIASKLGAKITATNRFLSRRTKENA